MPTNRCCQLLHKNITVLLFITACNLSSNMFTVGTKGNEEEYAPETTFCTNNLSVHDIT
jgi:hypothetical protein